MNNIKNILFPTDFSENSQNALTFALEIASASGATLHIMHSIEEPYNFALMSEAPITTEVEKSLSQRVKKLFNNLEEDIFQNNKYEGLNIETCMQTGGALYTILEETKNRNIDLIVMGTKGRTGLEKILFGSTTAEIVQRSDVPVLAVPKEAEYDGFKQVIFTTNYEDGDIKALKYVTNFAELFDSNIKVFHSSLDNDFRTKVTFRGFMEVAKETVPFKSIDFDHDTTISFFEAISDKIINGEFSLIVMTRYEQSLSIFKKHQTKEMSSYTIVPLLVLPGNKLTNQ